ncbi:MAG: DUF4450 domain-containing protein, partial [Lewinella sp.]|nr:DUF4450 domain-containing protein [Lewinella sp.]
MQVRLRQLLILLVLLTGGTTVLWAQQDPLVGTDYWHGVERSLRYRPEGDAFVIRNGERRFNRALYGGHSGLRVEAGDLPEFALYRPRLAGTLRLGILNDGRSQWLIDADSVTASYDPGLMRYLIRDDLLSDAWLELEVLAPQEQEGLLVRFRVNGPPAKVELVWAFGGASDERFSREGDIGADPESVFYLEPAHCQDNLFTVFEQGFTLRYPSLESGQAGAFKTLRGIFPPTSQQKTADAGRQGSPGELWSSTAAEQPLLAGKVALTADWQYGLISAGEGKAPPYLDLAALFARADAQRRVIANRVRVSTPDPFLNNLGGALAIAADAIWEEPAYHHGAIAWRQQLVGWRGAYVADPLGWHDRAHTHFSAYARSQLTEPASGPVVPDTSRNLARQVEEIGTAIFTEGYISRYPGGQRLRAHHYDMNQVYIDALLRHFDWTGDLAFAREMWPVIRRHLAWEKRCFDVDDDGLYDAYCSIWASDAVQYSGGGVTHASSYHYYSNTRAAELAVLLGEDPSPYRAEAARIKAALIEQLWMPEAGCFAEYKDLLGLRLLHRSPAVWTVYHAMDSEVPDPLQAYQMLDHVQREIPRIPIRAKGLPDTNLYTISTTNWLPYTWSVNNVALAEIMHTSLAFWQGGRADEAFLLWKSALMESMYLGASPGSFQQLSFYDAVRGELYRDFADPIAMTARALVEGLFGIRPDLLAGELHVAPGLPTEWDHAELSLPDISLAFERGSDQDRYRLEHRFAQSLTLRMQLRPRRVVDRVMVNGEAAEWRMLPEAVGRPLLDLVAAPASAYVVEVHYLEQDWPQLAASARSVAGQPWSLSAGEPELLDVFDPQGVWTDWAFSGDELAGKLSDQPGERTFFVQLEQHDARWWAPVPVDVLAPIALTTTSGPAADSCYWRVTNNTAERQPYTVRQAMTDGPVLHAG